MCIRDSACRILEEILTVRSVWKFRGIRVAVNPEFENKGSVRAYKCPGEIQGKCVNAVTQAVNRIIEKDVVCTPVVKGTGNIDKILIGLWVKMKCSDLVVHIASEGDGYCRCIKIIIM